MAPGKAQAAASFDDITKSLAAIKAVTGYTAQKVLLGIPAYGHLSVMDDKNTMAAADKQGVGTGFGQYTGDAWTQGADGLSTDSTAKNNTTARGVRGSGTYDYRCIQTGDCALQSDNVAPPKFPFSNNCGKGSISIDVKSGGSPYCQIDGLYLSYDNGVSTLAKMDKFVKGDGLGGAFLWEADGDITPETDTTNFPNSIVYNIQAGLSK
jgi:GH18 family chitinase